MLLQNVLLEQVFASESSLRLGLFQTNLDIVMIEMIEVVNSV